MPDYANVQFSRHWTELTVALNQLSSRYERQGRPEAARIIVRAWEWARQAQLRMAREMAVFATEELRKSERHTRVGRPQADPQVGGVRLEDHLRAEPMAEQNLLPGSVGVANYDELDRAVPWWVTNEIGSSTQVGRTIFGVFTGGTPDAPPSQDLFREHAVFAPTPARGGGGPGTINRPIPERRFIEKAVPIIDREWHNRFNAIKAHVVAEMRRAAVTMR